MARIVPLLSVASLALSGLAGCGDRLPATPQTGGDAPQAADLAEPTAATATATAVAKRGTAAGVSVESKDDWLEFAYSYPASVTAIAPLKARFDAERDETRTRMAAEGKAYKTEFPESGATYGFEKHWKVVTDLPRFLSLSADGYEYTGGAHGMPFTQGLVWDREKGVALEPLSFFLSGAALDAAAQAPFCKELDRQRREKRGIETGGDSSFNECLKPSEMVVLLGSAGRKAFDRVGIIALPYSAGPYAEGSYEVTLPVTPAILKAVKPEYRASFAAS